MVIRVSDPGSLLKIEFSDVLYNFSFRLVKFKKKNLFTLFSIIADRALIFSTMRQNIILRRFD